MARCYICGRDHDKPWQEGETACEGPYVYYPSSGRGVVEMLDQNGRPTGVKMAVDLAVRSTLTRQGDGSYVVVIHDDFIKAEG